MKRILVLLALFAQPALAAEQYIIPILASAISQKPFLSTLAMTNTTSSTINARITAVYPLETIPCDRFVPCFQTGDTQVRPHSTIVISGGGGPSLLVMAGDRLMTLGAVVVESDGPLIIESEAVRLAADGLSWQTIEIARSWLDGEAVVPRVLGAGPVNLFLVNPNDGPLTVDYWSDYGGAGQFTVAARATAYVPLPANFFCPAGCGGGEFPIGSAWPLHVRASASYLASVSVQSNWLPAVVRIARPVQ